MGGAFADAEALQMAREIGRAIADHGWVLLNGGRAAGVMDASAQAATEAGGLVIGVLPDCDDSRASEHLAIHIRTGIGDARNLVNVLSCDVVVALAGEAGTLSEVALALKNDRPVVCLGFDPGSVLERYARSGLMRTAATSAEAIRMVEEALRE